MIQKMFQSVGCWVVLVVVVVLIAIGLGLFGFVNSTRNEGIVREKALNAQYLDNQNYLSAYISGFYEQVGLVNAQSEMLDKILVDAVKGRYDDEGFGANGALFAAIAEAYPNTDELMKSWNGIQDYIRAQREGYRNQQSKLLDMLREYDTWRETDIIRSAVVRMLGFPSNGLEARVGEMVYQGEAARQKMYQIILTGKAIEAYNSGEMDPLAIPTKQK